LIKLEGCGVCGSNLPVWQGREWFNYPLTPGTPGHEGWGIISEIGPNVKNLKTGDRVAALSYNAFAEYDKANADAVIKIPDELSHIPFPGEPLGCALNIFNRSDIQPEQTVAIIGIGFLGLLLVQLVKSKGAKVIAITRREFALNLAKKSGADFIIPLNDYRKVIDEVRNITEGKMCERVIEAVGLQQPLDLAGDLISVRGKLIVAGYHQDGMRNINMQNWNWKGIDVINAHERDQKIYMKGISDAIDAVKNNLLKPLNLYTHHFLISEINEAFHLMNRRPDGFIKALIKY